MNSTAAQGEIWNTGQRTLAGFSFVVILTSFIGNSLIIIIVKRKIGGIKSSVNNFFVVNLSMADILMSARWLVLLSLNMSWGEVDMFSTVSAVPGEVFCKAMHFTMSAMYLVSMFLILAISVDRACAILCPLRVIITMKVARSTAGLAWGLPFLFASNALYFYRVVTEQGQPATCTLGLSTDLRSQFSLCYLFHTVVISVTFLVKATLYAAIAIKLRFRKIPGNLSTVAQRQRKRMNYKILTMLILLVLIFFVFQGPIWLYLMSHHFNILKNLNASLKSNTSFAAVAGFLALSYGSVNPYIMIMFLPNFRKAVGILLRSILPSRDSTSDQQAVVSQRNRHRNRANCVTVV